MTCQGLPEQGQSKTHKSPYLNQNIWKFSVKRTKELSRLNRNQLRHVTGLTTNRTLSLERSPVQIWNEKRFHLWTAPWNKLKTLHMSFVTVVLLNSRYYMFHCLSKTISCVVAWLICYMFQLNHVIFSFHAYNLFTMHCN